MLIAITGANGFIGTELSKYLSDKGHNIVKVPRHTLYKTELLKKELEAVDALIHLAGYPTFKRWTRKNRKLIYNSRILTSKNITKALNTMKSPPTVLINTSAIGIYNTLHYHDETSTDYASDFLGRVSRDWENSFRKLDTKRIRQVTTRLGVVIGEHGALRKMARPFFYGLGGKIGHGEYPFPFIHYKDLLKFYDEALNNADYEGVYNLVAPDIINNKELSAALSTHLRKPALFTIPVFSLKLLYGKGIYSLINNPIVIPRRLLERGFTFNYDTIQKSLEDIYPPKNRN